MITRFVIHKRESFAAGHEFPITGAYEKLVGKIYGDVDPEHRLNRVIIDLDKAPRNRRGVQYESDFFILKPLDVERGSWLEVRATFDNSERNPYNPDPTAEVRWGDQTWDEMMIGYVDFVIDP